MEILNETPVPTDTPMPPRESDRIAARFFARRDRLTLWCVVTALAAIACAILSAAVSFHASRQEAQFIVLDPAGNVFVAPGRAFDQAKELHTEQALLAASALLLRNPNGFDLPEVLQSLYTGDALAQAVKLKTGETGEFQQKQIDQKPNVTRLEALEVRPNAVVIRISGQLLRHGSFKQQTFTEVVPFTLNMVFKNNPDLLRNRRQPTVVTDFTLAYEAAH